MNYLKLIYKFDCKTLNMKIYYTLKRSYQSNNIKID